MNFDTPEMKGIVERLDKLETQNRRLKCGGIAILVAFSGLVAMGQSAPTPKVVEAQKFVLKDADGIVRGWLGVYAAGSELTLGNVNKQPQMRLLVSEDGSDLHFFGSHNGGMTLGVTFGKPTIAIAGSDGNGGAGIAFSEAGPSLTVNDRNGFSAVVGATQLKAQARSDAHPTSAASIALLDKDKNVIWQAP
ncbi:MAG: hypothetical protein WB987_14615 [Candidatus Acidiferrales bacterium]